MESAYLTFILAFSFAVCSCRVGITGWDDVVVAEENMPTVLGCSDETLKGDISIYWMVKSLGMDDWKPLLTSPGRNTLPSDSFKRAARLIDANCQYSGEFSLFLVPKVEDNGLYMCLVKQKKRKLKEKTILLAVLAVTLAPKPPIPQHSTLRLITRVTPEKAIFKMTWTAPGGIPLRSEKRPKTGTVAKLPQIQNSDGGTYVCSVYLGNGSTPALTKNVDLTVDADKVASFTNITHGFMIFTATQAQKTLPLTCPNINGDYVMVFRLPAGVNQGDMKLAYVYDRWRDSTFQPDQRKQLQLAGPPYDARAGNFSFLLTPDLKDAGLYACEVSLNDVFYSQRTTLSVLKVKTKYHALKLELLCLYSELSQVKSVKWIHRNDSRQPEMMSTGPGSISILLPLPVTPNISGTYTCILQLKDGQVIRANKAVMLPSKGSISVTTPPLPPSLSALLLLVPLAAAAVGGLLWRRKRISDRGVEQSLSVYSGEAENIYENPADSRQQVPLQSSVYMDLKPRGEDDIYKELERNEQCQGCSPTLISSSSSCHILSAPNCSEMLL